MRKIFVFFGVLLLTACSAENTPSESSEETKTEEVQQMVTGTHKLTMEVDGMVCKMGCGGSIRKGVKELGGIESVEFDFVEERLTNVATVLFDENSVSQESIIEKVKKLNDGQFSVGSVQVESISSSPVNEELTKKSNAAEGVQKEISSSSVQLPNLFDIFRNILLP